MIERGRDGGFSLRRHAFTLILATVNCGALAEPPLLPVGAAPEWRVRVAAEEGAALVSAVEDSTVPRMDLRLETQAAAESNTMRYACAVSDQSAGERAVVLALVVPFDATGWTWWDGPEGRRTISGQGVFADLTTDYYGALLMASRYPLAVIDNGAQAICLAVPPNPARAVRFLYDAATREFRAEFDFGLSSIPERFPSRADATVIAYSVPAKWAFRQALEGYYARYAACLTRRAGKGGGLLRGAPLDPIAQPEDFHFAWHDFAIEFSPVLDWAILDEVHGIESYLYREPQTHWRDLRGAATERTYENYLAQLAEDAELGDARSRATIVSGAFDADGRRNLYLEKVVWTAAAPFGVNAAPGVRDPEHPEWPNKPEFERSVLTPLLGWDEKPTDMDGVYFDSMQGWGNLRNYRREHWKTTAYPLTFDRTNGNAVCLQNIWGNVAYAETLSDELHRRGQKLCGNDVYFQVWYHLPFVDVAGRELSNFRDGVWAPVDDETYLYWRSMSARRPFWTLMNDPFDETHDPDIGAHMEAYFQRSLFFGVFPGMYHAHDGKSPWYWGTPAFYERDRPLFVKYMPLIQRLDAAGWEPVPCAQTEPASIRIERFGNAAAGTLAFTLHNPEPVPRETTLRLDYANLDLPQTIAAAEWLHPLPLTTSDETVRFTMPENGYAAIEIRPAQTP